MPAHARPDPESLLPLTPAALHIVFALAEGELHGYGIMREVEKLTEGQVVIGPGTLYRSIQKLLVDGMIAEASGRVAPPDDDERRRYYRLTALGRSAGELEAERLLALVRAARARGLLAPAARRRKETRA